MGFTSEIIIKFKTLAKSLVERSARGIVYLIIDDDTKATEEYNEYSSIEEIKSTDWTADNYKTIQLAFTEGVNQPYKVFVRRKNADTVSEILIELNGKKMTQLCYPECSEADDLSIRTWANGKLGDKDVVYVSEHGANTDSTAVVQVQNRTGEHATFGTMTAGQIAVAIAGMIAGCPLTQSLTAMRLKNFISMDFFEPKDGYLTIKDFGDSKVKVDYGINSRTTFTEEWKSDTRKIKVFEGMAIVRADIKQAFGDSWQGKYINNYDNKLQFFNIIKDAYFKEIEPNVLAEDYDNTIDIDIEKNKSFIVAEGKDPATMTETAIKVYPTGDKVYALSDVRFADTMDNLYLTIYM